MDTMDITSTLNDEQVLQMALECILHSEDRAALDSAEVVLVNYLIVKHDLQNGMCESDVNFINEQTGEEIAAYTFEYLYKKGWANYDDSIEAYELTEEGQVFFANLVQKRTDG